MGGQINYSNELGECPLQYIYSGLSSFVLSTVSDKSNAIRTYFVNFWYRRVPVPYRRISLLPVPYLTRSIPVVPYGTVHRELSGPCTVLVLVRHDIEFSATNHQSEGADSFERSLARSYVAYQ